ncbi:expressed unknown protein [Seminavis robusta]|uniref:Uncharacterized protein n=1 Tax=Seminavis robusta TaxID=568900 RepID=A0A9N8H2Z0_9STRA|nr:expressed unknown protein [Seminavis robusta]|eukprot:Sro27_g018190.1 n/a (529) ;mRNA; r:88141-89838
MTLNDDEEAAPMLTPTADKQGTGIPADAEGGCSTCHRRFLQVMLVLIVLLCVDIRTFFLGKLNPIEIEKEVSRKERTNTNTTARIPVPSPNEGAQDPISRDSVDGAVENPAQQSDEKTPSEPQPQPEPEPEPIIPMTPRPTQTPEPQTPKPTQAPQPEPQPQPAEPQPEPQSLPEPAAQTSPSVGTEGFQKSTRFSTPNDFTAHVQRGLNIIYTKSGCHMAAWIYHVDHGDLNSKNRKKYLDCSMYDGHWKKQTAEQLLASEDLRPNDTIYVQFMDLADFVQKFLVRNTRVQDLVLITGQKWNRFPERNTRKEKFYTSTTISSNPNVLHWFSHNTDHVGFCNKGCTVPLSPFPYGLRDESAVRHYQPVFTERIQNPQKTKTIYAGHLGDSAGQRSKANIAGTNTAKLPQSEYYQNMADYRYIVSPNGDRPECYRHYEAIGLGTKPITQLHPMVHSHLNGAVVYNNQNWDLEYLEKTLPMDDANPVDRHLVFEEYWMEYVEGLVGRNLRWFDRITGNHSRIADLAVINT